MTQLESANNSVLGLFRWIATLASPPASTQDTRRQFEGGSAIKRTFLQADSAALFLIAMILAAGAYLSFPRYDDAWLFLIVREHGHDAISPNLMDRPVFGFLLQRIVELVGVNKVVFVVLNTVVWLVAAVESAILFVKLFPEYRGHAVLAACLTLAPIVVQAQLCTVMVILPDILPTILCYVAILLLLREANRDGPTRPMLIGVAFALSLSGVAVSEYGVATNLVGVMILVGLGLATVTPVVRRCLFKWGGMLLILTLSGYALFMKIADLGSRPEVVPTVQLRSTLANWMGVPFDVASGTWRATIAAYARVLGTILVEWDSKSTIVGVSFGLLTAGLLWYGNRSRDAGPEGEDAPGRFTARFAILFLAVLAGLMPVRLMGRLTILDDFGSRFLIPIMPVAAALTAALFLNLVGQRRRWVAVAALGLVIGYATWMYAYTAVQQHRDIAGIGELLRPHVEKTLGVTVAVFPYNEFVNPYDKGRFSTTFDALNSELTGTLSSSWPLELEERLWVTGPQYAEIHFGPRTACSPTSELDAYVRNFQRIGKLDAILWVDYQPGKPVSVEPYCLSAN